MKRLLLVAVCLVCALFVAGPSSAVELTIDDVIGTVIPSNPASTEAERTYSQKLIDLYNAGTLTPVTDTLIPPHSVTFNVYDPNYNDFIVDFGGPLPAATGGVDLGLGVNGVFNTAGYTYLYAKFGNNGVLYWLDGATSVSNLVAPSGLGLEGGTGLSGVRLYTQVPEGGTLMLLGFGLAGVGTFRRFMKR